MEIPEDTFEFVLPLEAVEVIENCVAEAWRTAEQNDVHTPADYAADIAQFLVDVYRVKTYPRHEDI